MRLILLSVFLMVILIPHHIDSFLFPKPPVALTTPRLKVLGGVAVIAFRKNKQLKYKLLLQKTKKRRRRRKNIILLQKKKKKQKKTFLAGGTALVVAAGPLAAAAAITTATVGVVGVTAAAVAAAVAVLNSVETSEIYTPEENSLNGQSILITGGTSGLGLETAKRLSIGRPMNIIITARTPEKGQNAVASIEEYLSENQKTTSRYNNDNNNDDDDENNNRTSVNVSYRVLDLDDVQGIQESVAEWLKDDAFPDQLDCLINNAGVLNIPKLEKTIDGIERQMSSNHLGHFVLTKMLASRLSNKAKIINVSSSAHQIATRFDGGMDFDYCWEGSGSSNYSPWKSYGQSKLANILFSQELQRRSNDAGYKWDVACLHPGAVQTDIWRQSIGGLENYQRIHDFQKNVIQDNLPTVITDSFDTLLTKTGDIGLLKTPEQGATTSVWLASGGYNQNNNDMDNNNNIVVTTDAQYYDNCKPQSLSEFAMDTDAAQRLWEESEERAGIRFDFLFNHNSNENDNNVVESSVAKVDDVVEDEDEVVKEIVEQLTEEVVKEIVEQEAEGEADVEENKDDETDDDDDELSTAKDGKGNKESVEQAEAEDVDENDNDETKDNDESSTTKEGKVNKKIVVQEQEEAEDVDANVDDE